MFLEAVLQYRFADGPSLLVACITATIATVPDVSLLETVCEYRSRLLGLQ